MQYSLQSSHFPHLGCFPHIVVSVAREDEGRMMLFIVCYLILYRLLSVRLPDNPCGNITSARLISVPQIPNAISVTQVGLHYLLQLKFFNMRV